VKSLADGKKKITLLTIAPANEEAPTAVELNAGEDISCNVLDSDFNWTNTDSATFDEKPACAKGQVLALGASNYDLAATFIREYLETGGTVGAADIAGLDAGYQAVKTKGSVVWIYVRETAKDSDEDWAAADEIYLGGKVQSDAPARVNNDGNIKRRVKFLPQRMFEDIAVAA
jgi:hypothetical protein